MNIGQAARATGVSAHMIRHYERIGLLQQAPRSAAGYRFFHEHDLAALRFIRSARQLDFSLEQIAELLALWRNRERPSAEVKALAQKHMAELHQQIQSLQMMHDFLHELSARCPGNEHSECPILDKLDGKC